MNRFQKTSSRRAAVTVAIALALATGLMNATASSSGSTAFDDKLASAIAHVKADPDYKIIPLGSRTNREWFLDECHSLYTKKISKEQFVAEGSKQFPGYDASFSELADQLTTP
jgi:hypothetical protein